MFNTKAVAAQLVTILSGLSGMGEAQIGMPAKTLPRVCAYVTQGSKTTRRKTTDTLVRDTRFYIGFGYRVDGAETTTEETLMDLVDAFEVALWADVTLGGTCVGIEVDTGLADQPDYQMRVDKEYREYPVVVTARQQGSYGGGS